MLVQMPRMCSQFNRVQIQRCPTRTRDVFFFRWQRASIQTEELLRPDVLLPLHPDKKLPEQVWKNVDSGVALPKWHCCFKGCRICSDDVRDQRDHEVGLWGHIWRKDTNKPALLTAIQTFRLTEGDMNDEEIAFALFNAALVDSERQLCPLVGVSTERR